MLKFLTLSLLICSLWAGSATYQTFYQYKLQEFSQMKKSELIFLGDSLTMRHNWSNFKASNMGIDGDTTGGILSRLHYAKQAKHVVLMIGVNDILSQIPIRNIQDNYRRILESFSKDKKVTILSLLPVIDDRGTKSINQDIKTMNRWLEIQATKYSFNYIKLYPHFLDANKKGLKNSFTTDGIHLTEKAYKMWEKVLRDKLKLD